MGTLGWQETTNRASSIKITASKEVVSLIRQND